MDEFTSYDALLLRSDGRTPSIVSLLTVSATTDSIYSPISARDYGRIPFPEVHMQYIAQDLPRAWHSQIAPRLRGMSADFASPYIIFYPIVSEDGMPFPVNRTTRHIQGMKFNIEQAWRGNLVVAKFTDFRMNTLTNMSIADYPVVRNYLSSNGPYVT
ncbi:hypothetical protein BV25DRAFT_1838594 [Artomyces pyxidatus]|uniref:Uncharacterized protein n=1 Tax=Artomyces pyxidatus TaxID=48021 RepID=A0ACB8T0U9_9AGAM|nr:hypothetical protein BV25DRAFT_1838594 [Artomyces pyxidatus]